MIRRQVSYTNTLSSPLVEGRSRKGPHIVGLRHAAYRRDDHHIAHISVQTQAMHVQSCPETYSDHFSLGPYLISPVLYFSPLSTNHISESSSISPVSCSKPASKRDVRCLTSSVCAVASCLCSATLSNSEMAPAIASLFSRRSWSWFLIRSMFSLRAFASCSALLDAKFCPICALKLGLCNNISKTCCIAGLSAVM